MRIFFPGVVVALGRFAIACAWKVITVRSVMMHPRIGSGTRKAKVGDDLHRISACDFTREQTDPPDNGIEVQSWKAKCRGLRTKTLKRCACLIETAQSSDERAQLVDRKVRFSIDGEVVRTREVAFNDVVCHPLELCW